MKLRFDIRVRNGRIPTEKSKGFKLLAGLYNFLIRNTHQSPLH